MFFFRFNNKICFLLFWKNRVTTEVDLLCSQIGFPHPPLPFSFLIFFYAAILISRSSLFFLTIYLDRLSCIFFDPRKRFLYFRGAFLIVPRPALGLSRLRLFAASDSHCVQPVTILIVNSFTTLF